MTVPATGGRPSAAVTVAREGLQKSAENRVWRWLRTLRWSHELLLHDR